MKPALELSAGDRECLTGRHGEVLRFAMEMLVRVGEVSDSRRLIDITQAHLVGSYDSGSANLRLLEKVVGSGLRVAVPTTLNASDVDLGQPAAGGEAGSAFSRSCRIVHLLQAIGCRAELTCAPYHLPSAPARGECIAWAESNAVAYANSVLGARTNRTYQYLDLCAALTGRIPEQGLYLDCNRRGTCLVEIADVPQHWLDDDSFYQLLGLHLGAVLDDEVPVLEGLPPCTSRDHLRSLGAAAASSGNLSLIHAIGLTPEAPDLDTALQGEAPPHRIRVAPDDLVAARDALERGAGDELAAVCTGAPHASLPELQALEELLAGRRVAPCVRFLVSTSRHVRQQSEANGLLDRLQRAGVRVVTDTCTYYGSTLGDGIGQVMTNSAKWAWYAPANLGVQVRFGRTAECVESAVAGRVIRDAVYWRR